MHITIHPCLNTQATSRSTNDRVCVLTWIFRIPCLPSIHKLVHPNSMNIHRDQIQNHYIHIQCMHMDYSTPCFPSIHKLVHLNSMIYIKTKLRSIIYTFNVCTWIIPVPCSPSIHKLVHSNSIGIHRPNWEALSKMSMYSHRLWEYHTFHPSQTIIHSNSIRYI